LRSLRKGKCVIPLLAEDGADIPLHLETKNYLKFTTNGAYTKSFALLLKDLHAGKGVPLRGEFKQTYVTAPPLPVNFVERPDELAALRDALISEDGGHHIALTALHGMGGIGKTVLAQALCQDEVVQQAFPDGVIWISVGKESTSDAVTRMREVGKALGDDLTRYDNELGAKNQYRTTVRKKAALIVVDDVWKSGDIEPLRADSPRSRLLFTTRDARIAAAVGAREHVANLLTEKQSREVFVRWSGADVAKLPQIAGELIQQCGGLPLALSMVGAMVRGRPATYWGAVLEHLRNADLDKIKVQFPDYPYTDVLRAVQVSVDSLDPTTRERYIALAVLLEEMAAAPQVQKCIWGVDKNEAAETAEQFISLSLAQRHSADEGIRLHDLQLDYVRAQYADKEALELIQGAIRLSAHVIGKDTNQFSSQMVGRLLPYCDNSAIERFAENVVEGMQTPWLRPLQPALYPPGTGLVRLLEGHKGGVTAVAVTPDGLRAVSASADHTLEVWNLETGRKLRTLSGHSSEVNSVALTPDGQRAVSASGDWTLKVWDVGSGCELRTLAGHFAAVISVAVMPDGQRAVSASRDRTLKLWDLATGRELRTIVAHSYWVTAVTVTPDGQRALSASMDHTLWVWDLASGRELRTIAGHAGAVNAVAVTPDWQRAVSASADHTLKVWDLATGCELRVLTGHSAEVTAVVVMPDGQRALSGSEDRTLKLWDLATGRELRTLTGHAGGVTAVAVTPDGHQAVSASADHTLKVWDLATGCELRTIEAHWDGVVAVAVMPDGQRAVSASGFRLKVWDVASGRELPTISGNWEEVTAMAVMPDGERMVSASGFRLKVWDVASCNALCTLEGHSRVVSGVAVTPDGRRALSASSDRTLKLWDLRTGEALATFTCDSRASCCAYSDALKLIVAGDAGGHVHFLRLEEPTPKRIG
jgi:WD40 repeat protein